MKRIKTLLLTACLVSPGLFSTASAGEEADSTGMPGDNFSLQGALEMFKKASSLEEFEKLLNSEDNSVNDLDLNGDGETDYVRVEDRMDGGAHAIVLQVPVSDTESQDLAVIEIEKNGEASAQLQILGDEDVYGEQKIIEPVEVTDVRKKGPSSPELITRGVWVNVWLWPSVRFIYAPVYVVWVSPWKWRHYPGWYRPWKPHPWRWHYSHCAHYHAYHHPVAVHRVVVAHKVYTPYRKSSPVVVQRHRAANDNYKARRSAPRMSPAPSKGNRGGGAQRAAPPKQQQRVSPAPNGGGHKGGGGGGARNHNGGGGGGKGGGGGRRH